MVLDFIFRQPPPAQEDGLLLSTTVRLLFILGRGVSREMQAAIGRELAGKYYDFSATIVKSRTI